MFNAHLQLVDGSLMRKIRQRSFQSYEIIEFSLSWISIVEIFSLPLYAQPLPLENPLPSIFFLFFFSTLNMGTESCCVGDLMSPTISPILDTIYIYIYIYIYFRKAIVPSSGTQPLFVTVTLSGFIDTDWDHLRGLELRVD